MSEQPKKKGRPSIQMQLGITPETVTETVKQFNGSCAKAADALGISAKSVHRYLKAGTRTWSILNQGTKSRVDLWIEEHGMPKDVFDFMEKTGIPKGTIVNCLTRRRNRIKAALEALGDFRDEGLYLEDVRGRRFWTRFIVSYKLDLDLWHNRVIIDAVVSVGKVQFNLAIDFYKKLFTPKTTSPT